MTAVRRVEPGTLPCNACPPVFSDWREVAGGAVARDAYERLNAVVVLEQGGVALALCHSHALAWYGSEARLAEALGEPAQEGESNG